ncbi:hypothetical protein [Methylophaga sp.]|uniref:hypothetical protein n=1 Tax=Methylophaga sp. TaxID=2024840 RepID=UPI001400FE0C|nr:hypothetical protein [Methylophaga sp.]MTI64401.1 hypothetical protein [Methylophaga sp.]
MQSSKQPQIINPSLPAIDLPGVLTTQAVDAYARQLGADSPDADNLVKQVAQVQSKAASLWESFNQVRANRNPGNTPASHLQKLEKASQQLQKTLFRESDIIKDRLKLREQEIDREIEARFMQSSNDAGEVRAVLRNMETVAERTAAVMAAIDEGDASVLAAVISGKPVTTGIDAKYVKTLREYGEKKLAADLTAKKQQVKKASDLLVNIIDETITLQDKAIGTPELRAQFEQQALEADNAALNFSRLLGANND